jgi:HEPN domain-containing protein
MSAMDEKINYWLDIAEYDLATAEAVLKAERYLYVGFMCHQAIEKTLKAHYQLLKGKIPPKTHNILFLLKETALFDSLSDQQKAFMEMLRPMNIETRYPEVKDRLFKSLDREKCTKILHETREMHAWIKEKLKEKQEVMQAQQEMS